MDFFSYFVSDYTQICYHDIVREISFILHTKVTLLVWRPNSGRTLLLGGEITRGFPRGIPPDLDQHG